ncbi:MAG: HAD family hydrolase [Acetatifactor sp.]|nr:HAD family hydrolase [Acetatifactor sp.]
MRTLYISDLDGTLLQSNERTSEYTNRTINALIDRGMLFSYATARSYLTASKVAAGLRTDVPLVVYNGAALVDGRDGSPMLKNFFGPEIGEVLGDLAANGIYPIVYAYLENEEKFSYIPARCTPGMRKFLDSRKGDRRTHPVADEKGLRQGEIFYLTCIDQKEKLEPLYEKYRDRYHCVFQTELYTQEQWLEIMPLEASKSHAIAQLKKQLGCDRLVVFGDGKNDMDMFEAADEAYAVENAVPELKAIATAVIGSNDSDGVARWLEEHWSAREERS